MPNEEKESEKEVEKIINKLISFMKIVEPKEKVNIIRDDPDDNKIIECAIASNSEYILTYDNHLLLIKRFQGIQIITPEEFLKTFNLN